MLEFFSISNNENYSVNMQLQYIIINYYLFPWLWELRSSEFFCRFPFGHLHFNIILESLDNWQKWVECFLFLFFGHNVTKVKQMFIFPLNEQHVSCSNPWFVWKTICMIGLLILFCILASLSQFTNNSIVWCSTTKCIWIFWLSWYFLSALPFLRYLSDDFV